MEKEEFKPVDFGHLEDKILSIVDCFRKVNDIDRSDEYRQFHLNKAEQMSKTLLSDFSYYFDTYLFGGIEPYGLSEKKENNLI